VLGGRPLNEAGRVAVSGVTPAVAGGIRVA
jgi:hypothetical protein